MAARIGRRICDEAIWHDGRCNWIGASNEERPFGQVGVSYGALGPDFYGGTSGIGFFLAQLYLVTGDKEARRIRDRCYPTGHLPHR